MDVGDVGDVGDMGDVGDVGDVWSVVLGVCRGAGNADVVDVYAPNLKTHSDKNYSSGKKIKKDLYFWERPKRAKNQLQKLQFQKTEKD